MRVPLRDGMWVELKEGITHGEDTALLRLKARSNREPEAGVDWADLLVATFIADWHVVDRTGNEIPWEGLASLALAPDDIIDAIWGPVDGLYKASTEPSVLYAKLIGRLVLGQRISDAEIAALPDPETFKDALLLATVNLTLSPKELKDMDALLLSLVQKIRNAKRAKD